MLEKGKQAPSGRPRRRAAAPPAASAGPGGAAAPAGRRRGRASRGGRSRAVKGPSGSWTAVNFPALGMGYWEEHWARVTNLYPFRQVPTFLWVRVAKRQEVPDSGAAACDSPGARALSLPLHHDEGRLRDRSLSPLCFVSLLRFACCSWKKSVKMDN